MLWKRLANSGLIGVLWWYALAEQFAFADEPQLAAAESRDNAPNVEFFEKKIRPLLAAKCLECHGSDKQKGNLRLDSAEGLSKGGDSGAVVVPGKPAESLLVDAIRYTGDLKMPPKSKLADAEIALLVEWVERGAVWPKSKAALPAQPAGDDGPIFSDEDRSFWAFQPIARPPLPAVKNAEWCTSPIDFFILSELEAHGLQPAARADKRTLIRRLTFDLTGLPPAPEEVRSFLADDSPDAWARVVDRLLASPRYGERWGRHWLDVARYADSNGLDENLAYANAFRYRDYVVAALNRDKPFDEFLHEQIAGDLLPDDGPIDHQLERITATGFLALGAKMLAEDDPVKMQMDIIDEQVDTLGRAVLGLTLGCARCHAHKFDPIPQEDYYSLAGIFKSTKTMENFSVIARWQERPLGEPALVERRLSIQKQIAEQKAQLTRETDQANAALLKEARRHVARYLVAAVDQQRVDMLVKQTQPAGNDPASKDRPGAILLEAENYDRGNVLKDTTNYGKEIGVLVNKGELPNFTEYDFTIAEAGLYQCEIRYAASASRPCQLLINGRLMKSDAAGKTTGTWFPDTQTWFVEGFFPLAAGKTTLRLENAQAFPHIDKLLLVPARDKTGQPVEITEPAAGPQDGYHLNPELVRQWAAYLEQAGKDADSPFSAWVEMCRAAFPGLKPQIDPAAPLEPKTKSDGIPATSQSKSIEILRERLTAEPRPMTPATLAARYQELCDAADDAWIALQATPEGKSATALADPGQEVLRAALYDTKGPLALPKNTEEQYPESTLTAIRKQKDEIKSLEQSLPVLPETMAVSDAKPENLRVHLRGNHLTLGAEVPRQFPRILAGENQKPLGATGSGRLQLAHWLTAPDQPLTSRVIANRVWLWHLGEGLVRSPDNFGRLGERPTHPQLLDFLAGELMRQGWSLKALHRLIVLSSTYQMSTAFDERAAGVDPENRLWWRMSRRRLEAEAIRDAILDVAGTSDPQMGGSLLPTANRQYVTSTANVNPVVYETNRRSIYLPVVRSALYDVFQAFDFADPSVLSGKRDNTTVAPQALFMMNSGFVLKQTRALAEKLLANAMQDDSGRVRLLYEMALARPPTARETERALDYVTRYEQAVGGQPPAAERHVRAWQSLCRTVLASNEFVYLE